MHDAVPDEIYSRKTNDGSLSPSFSVGSVAYRKSLIVRADASVNLLWYTSQFILRERNADFYGDLCPRLLSRRGVNRVDSSDPKRDTRDAKIVDDTRRLTTSNEDRGTRGPPFAYFPNYAVYRVWFIPRTKFTEAAGETRFSSSLVIATALMITTMRLSLSRRDCVDWTGNENNNTVSSEESKRKYTFGSNTLYGYTLLLT